MLDGVDAVVTVDGKTGTQLWWAARAICMGDEGEAGVAVAGGLTRAKLLLQEGADVNAVGGDGSGYECTALWQGPYTSIIFSQTISFKSARVLEVLSLTG